jgi:hypothetical protein
MLAYRLAIGSHLLARRVRVAYPRSKADRSATAETQGDNRLEGDLKCSQPEISAGHDP